MSRNDKKKAIADFCNGLLVSWFGPENAQLDSSSDSNKPAKDDT